MKIAADPTPRALVEAGAWRWLILSRLGANPAPPDPPVRSPALPGSPAPALIETAAHPRLRDVAASLRRPGAVDVAFYAWPRANLSLFYRASRITAPVSLGSVPALGGGEAEDMHLH